MNHDILYCVFISVVYIRLKISKQISVYVFSEVFSFSEVLVIAGFQCKVINIFK